MEREIEKIVDEYASEKLDRRGFFARLIAVTGTYAAAQLFLERSGLAQGVVSQVESKKFDVDSASVDYMNGSVKLSGYLSKPKKKGKYPAILVIHENRGLNDHMRDVARRFAAEGFAALAVDALSRKGGTAAMDTPENALVQQPPRIAFLRRRRRALCDDATELSQPARPPIRSAGRPPATPPRRAPRRSAASPVPRRRLE